MLQQLNTLIFKTKIALEDQSISWEEKERLIKLLNALKLKRCELKGADAGVIDIPVTIDAACFALWKTTTQEWFGRKKLISVPLH